MITTAERTDADMKTDVLSELAFEPSIQVTDIGVLVKDGVVTLNGRAENHGEKQNAIRAAMRVTGVVAVADDIEVDLPEFGRRTDGDIAAAAANRIAWSTMIPAGAVEVTVREGRINLAGVVEWGYQREAAEAVLQHLAGVKGISNGITVNPTQAASGIGLDIRSALRRNALLDDSEIQVETSGNCVVLSGKVHNHTESEEAVRLAWAAPGVHTVDNQLKVDWFWGLAD